jgi:hypothetical protein
MSSEDPLKSVTKGVVEGFLEWSDEKVKQLAQKFRDRKIAFCQDVEIIRVAKEQRQTSEWELFLQYVEDDRLHILFQMGLTLRQLEKSQKQREALRGRILKKYGAEGLHISQFVQNGFFPKYLSIILERATTPEDTRLEIKNLFKNIEITNSFIQITDSVEKEAATIVARIQSHSPTTYIISGSMSATNKCKRVKDIVMRKILGYREELYRTEIKEVYFLNKVDK